MSDNNRLPPASGEPGPSDEDVERTGRTDQVAPDQALGAQAPTGGQPDGLDDDDAPPGGVDSADFPGLGAP